MSRNSMRPISVVVALLRLVDRFLSWGKWIFELSISAAKGVFMSDKMSKYEEQALLQIHEWKNPRVGWFGKSMELINWPLCKAKELIGKIPGADWVVEEALGLEIGNLPKFVTLV